MRKTTKTAFFPILPSFFQLSRSGTPAKNGKLINLNTSIAGIVNASSIARGIVQYSMMIKNNKIPASPFAFHFRNKVGNIFWKNGAIKKPAMTRSGIRSEEHTSELQSRFNLVCHLLLEE